MDTLYILQLAIPSLYSIGTTDDFPLLIEDYKRRDFVELSILYQHASRKAQMIGQVIRSDYRSGQLGEHWFYLPQVSASTLIEKIRFLERIDGQILMDHLPVDSLRAFFAARPALSVSKIEAQAGIPAKTLWFVLKHAPGRNLSPMQKLQLLPVLLAYGFSLTATY